MAKAPSPVRLQAELMKAASATGELSKRSAAEQVEYWASLGRTVSNALTPDILVEIASGLAHIRIEKVLATPVASSRVFDALESDRQSGRLTETITSEGIRYQASTTTPGMLDEISPNGTIRVGQFSNGAFIPKASST